MKCSYCPNQLTVHNGFLSCLSHNSIWRIQYILDVNSTINTIYFDLLKTYSDYLSLKIKQNKSTIFLYDKTYRFNYILDVSPENIIEKIKIFTLFS